MHEQPASATSWSSGEVSISPNSYLDPILALLSC